MRHPKLRKPSKRLLATLRANKRRDWTVKRLKQQGGLCYWCARPVTEPSCDHLVPLSKGGEDHYENVVASHPWCNAAKADRLPADFAEPGQFDAREAIRRMEGRGMRRDPDAISKLRREVAEIEARKVLSRKDVVAILCRQARDHVWLWLRRASGAPDRGRD